MLRAVIPGIMLLLVVVAGMLPLGWPLPASMSLSFAAIAVVCHWSTKRPRHMPPWLAFSAGLALDAALDSPLGFWAMLLLIGQAAALGARRFPAVQEPLWSWVFFALLVAALTLAGWLIASLYSVRWLDWRPMWLAALSAAAFQPLLRGLLELVDRLVTSQEEQRPLLRR